MDDDGWYAITGTVIGWLGGVVTFIGIYIAAVSSVGWVVGLALGWVAAYLGAALCFFLLRFLWLPALLLIAVGIASDFS